jgi:D-alanine-D-alanine ligase
MISELQRAVIAHNEIGPDADPSTADVLDQVALVERGLAELGVLAERVAVREGRVWETLSPDAAVVVFNLVEAPPGQVQQQLGATAALELLGVAFTGASAGAMWLTTDKLVTRAVLASAGLPVPPGGEFDPDRPALLEHVAAPWLLKPGREDASVGLEGDPVCRTAGEAVKRARMLRSRFPGQPVLLEHFLPGREFNIAVLEVGGRPHVLPMAEMVFLAGAPAVVSYEAKWHEDSEEYRRTVRRFLDTDREDGLGERLRSLVERSWEVTGAEGYARVDLRLDETGEPHILEVNTNPCISADAGFMAACREAGLTTGEVIGRILEAALRRRANRSGG